MEAPSHTYAVIARKDFPCDACAAFLKIDKSRIGAFSDAEKLIIKRAKNNNYQIKEHESYTADPCRGENFRASREMHTICLKYNFYPSQKINITHPVMRYHGGKFRLAPWIISHFPEHYTYVEPYSGAASVLMTKNPSFSEVYNDIDDDIVNVFQILRDDTLSAKLINQIALTPFSRSDFNIAFHHSKNPVERARRTLVRSHMGFGSGSVSIESNSGFKLDSYRKPSTGAVLWAKYPLLIRQFCQRLEGVIIENRDALRVMDNHDRTDTLFYLDPPYIQSTRKKPQHTKIYSHEMNDHDHAELLVKIKQLKGMVVLSGYDTLTYNLELDGWTKHQKKVQASSNRGSTSRIECLWLNAACAAAVPQKKLF